MQILAATTDAQHAAVIELHAVARRDPCSGFGTPTVDANATGFDPALNLAPRTPAGAGQHLVYAFAGGVFSHVFVSGFQGWAAGVSSSCAGS